MLVEVREHDAEWLAEPVVTEVVEARLGPGRVEHGLGSERQIGGEGLDRAHHLVDVRRETRVGEIVDADRRRSPCHGRSVAGGVHRRPLGRLASCTGDRRGGEGREGIESHRRAGIPGTT